VELRLSQLRRGTQGLVSRKSTETTANRRKPNRQSWLLLNASPDLRAQIEDNTFLHPRIGMRDSPIAGVVLTSADLDQALGLLLLREFQPIHIFATESVRRVLVDDNSIFSMLNRVQPQASWQIISPGNSFRFPGATGSTTEILPVHVANPFPSYVSERRAAALNASESTLGLILKSESGLTLGYFPTVGRLEEELLQSLNSLDVLLFDGTFWRDTELMDVQSGVRTGREMGHIPVSSDAGSLALLSKIRCPRKIFVHMNNTNPMLDESGPEYRQVRNAGWEIAEDGCHFEL
jgi:pyrroloquinoline quinone biosynthesis protein B